MSEMTLEHGISGLVDVLIRNLCGRSGFDAAFDVGHEVLREIEDEMATAIKTFIDAHLTRAPVQVTDTKPAAYIAQYWMHGETHMELVWEEGEDDSKEYVPLYREVYEDAFMELVHNKFRSGNSIPVERITIKREEYESLSARLAQTVVDEPEGMVLVTQEDGNNYCRIVSLLGMEEEGDVVAAVEALLSQRQPHEALFTGTLNGCHVGLHGTRESVESLERFIDSQRQPVVAVDLPEEPVRMRHEWSTAKLGECVSCGQRRHGVIVDGELTCASCIDARRLDEWQSYAFKLRKLLEATSQRHPHGAQCGEVQVEADPRIESDSAEDIAQWLYANGYHKAASTVRGQLDIRNARIRQLEVERAAVAEGWLFYFADDDGRPHAHYCRSRDEVYAQVAEWMTGERDGEAVGDAGNDMIAGVTDTLIDTGAFYPEGDPPCFLRKISAAPTLAGKENS